MGRGRIDDNALYESLDRIVTLIAEEEIRVDQNHFFQIPLPESWWRGGRRLRSIRVALAYAPETRTTRMDYRATKIRFSFVSADTLDEVTAAFRRNRENGLAERNSNRWISTDKRSNGTLQVSKWEFRRRVQRNNLFVVVSRQDPPWSSVSDLPESYAISVVLSDREQVDATLYAEIRAVLQARARVRLQV